MELPIDFTNEMKDLLKDEYNDFLASYDQKPTKAYRINTVKRCGFDLTTFGRTPVPYAENCYYLEDDSLGRSAFHHAGAVYIQEPSAMIPALVLNPSKNQKVLDLCASPGGKTGQLSALIGENGLLVSNECNPTRNRTLVGNVERLGLTNTIVTNSTPEKMAKNAFGFFDAVLIDAPCSGEGMFRKNPEAIKEWSSAHSVSISELQKEILKYGSKCVKKGGFLVYSTCTFSERENEDVVRSLLESGEFELLPIPSIFPVAEGVKPLNECGRLYPHKIKGEGHFVALMRRLSETEEAKFKSPLRDPTSNELNLARSFFDQINGSFSPKVYKNSLVIPPKILPPVPAKEITALGVKAGDFEKRFIPHHQIFSAYGNLFKNQVALSISDEKLKKYIHGDEIDVDNPDGWAVVTVEGCPLGGVKIVSGKAKNHYPKGLRSMK